MTPASNTLKSAISSLIHSKGNLQTSPTRRDAGDSLSQSGPSLLSPAYV